MTEIRLFEKRAYDLFMQNLIKGTTHWVRARRPSRPACSQAMRDDDYMFVTYRGHNHGWPADPMTQVMAELLGRENGLMHGKGGSMHLLVHLPRILRRLRDHRRAAGPSPTVGLVGPVPRTGRSRSASSATAPPTSAPS